MHVLGSMLGYGDAEMIPLYDRRTRVLWIRFLLIIRGYGSNKFWTGKETHSELLILKLGERFISEVLEMMRARIMSSKQVSLDFTPLMCVLEIFMTNDLFSLNLSSLICKIKLLSSSLRSLLITTYTSLSSSFSVIRQISRLMYTLTWSVCMNHLC